MPTDLESLLARIGATPQYRGVKLVDANQRSNFGSTPLSVAISWSDIEAVRILLDAGADPNATFDHGHTPLLNAVMFGHVGIARLLLDNGAAIDSANELGLTSLAVAKSGGNPELISLIYSAMDAAKRAKGQI